jgi:hypothetical protein
MAHRYETLPIVIGVRLSKADEQKLHKLCAHTQRPPSELMRLLLRTAQPVDVAPIHFVAQGEPETQPELVAGESGR